jgi:hypothetical protein
MTQKLKTKSTPANSAQFEQFGLPFSAISSTIQALFNNNSTTIRDNWRYGTSRS